jgi:hypothetical protein
LEIIISGVGYYLARITCALCRAPPSRSTDREYDTQAVPSEDSEVQGRYRISPRSKWACTRAHDLISLPALPRYEAGAPLFPQCPTSERASSGRRYQKPRHGRPQRRGGDTHTVRRYRRRAVGTGRSRYRDNHTGPAGPASTVRVRLWLPRMPRWVLMLERGRSLVLRCEALGDWTCDSQLDTEQCGRADKLGPATGEDERQSQL